MIKADFIGEMKHIMKVYRNILRLPIARVQVNTPFYVVGVEALCLNNPFFDLIIENVLGALKSVGSNLE